MFKCIAVDDEQNALNRFERMIAQDERLSLEGTFTSPSDAVEFIKEHPVDIAFLDIEMPQMTGLELAEVLMDYNPYIEVVFVTAYNQYALEAFKAHATGYLLKPLARDAFQRQIDIMETKLKKDHTPTGNKLTVSCFGSFSIKKPGDDGELIRFRTSKAEELLAYLIHNEGRARSKDMILDTLWPETDPDKAANNFRVTCTYIRSTLADIGYTDILVRDHDDYSVNISMITCDYIKFRKGVSNMDALTLAEAEELSRLYTGGYLENRFYEWADESRSWLETRYIQLMYHLGSLYKSQDKVDRAINAYEAVLRVDLYEEEALREVLSLKAKKLPANAIREYYDKYVHQLSEEYGSDPSKETRDLVKKLF